LKRRGARLVLVKREAASGQSNRAAIPKGGGRLSEHSTAPKIHRAPVRLVQRPPIGVIELCQSKNQKNNLNQTHAHPSHPPAKPRNFSPPMLRAGPRFARPPTPRVSRRLGPFCQGGRALPTVLNRPQQNLLKGATHEVQPAPTFSRRRIPRDRRRNLHLRRRPARQHHHRPARRHRHAQRHIVIRHQPIRQHRMPGLKFPLVALMATL